MFITRATRRDLDEVLEFYNSHDWYEDWETPELKVGTVFFARKGEIIGAIRLIEIEPQIVIVEDVLVHRDHRAQGLGKQLMQAAMNSRGGKLYLSCHLDTIPFYERFGFADQEWEALPESVKAYMIQTKAYPPQDDHVHYFLTAR